MKHIFEKTHAIPAGIKLKQDLFRQQLMAALKEETGMAVLDKLLKDYHTPDISVETIELSRYEEKRLQVSIDFSASNNLNDYFQSHQEEIIYEVPKSQFEKIYRAKEIKLHNVLNDFLYSLESHNRIPRKFFSSLEGKEVTTTIQRVLRKKLLKLSAKRYWRMAYQLAGGIVVAIGVLFLIQYFFSSFEDRNDDLVDAESQWYRLEGSSSLQDLFTYEEENRGNKWGQKARYRIEEMRKRYSSTRL